MCAPASVYTLTRSVRHVRRCRVLHKVGTWDPKTKGHLDVAEIIALVRDCAFLRLSPRPTLLPPLDDLGPRGTRGPMAALSAASLDSAAGDAQCPALRRCYVTPTAATPGAPAVFAEQSNAVRQPRVGDSWSSGGNSGLVCLRVPEHLLLAGESRLFVSRRCVHQVLSPL